MRRGRAVHGIGSGGDAARGLRGPAAARVGPMDAQCRQAGIVRGTSGTGAARPPLEPGQADGGRAPRQKVQVRAVAAQTAGGQQRAAAGAGAENPQVPGAGRPPFAARRVRRVHQRRTGCAAGRPHAVRRPGRVRRRPGTRRARRAQSLRVAGRAAPRPVPGLALRGVRAAPQQPGRPVAAVPPHPRGEQTAERAVADQRAAGLPGAARVRCPPQRTRSTANGKYYLDDYCS